jgi:hypothetical protein
MDANTEVVTTTCGRSSDAFSSLEEHAARSGKAATNNLGMILISPA